MTGAGGGHYSEIKMREAADPNNVEATIHMKDGPPMVIVSVHNVQVWPALQRMVAPCDASAVHDTMPAPSAVGLRLEKDPPPKQKKVRG